MVVDDPKVVRAVLAEEDLADDEHCEEENEVGDDNCDIQTIVNIIYLTVSFSS